MSESGEDEALAVGRLDGLLDEAKLDWAFIDADGEIKVGGEFAGDFCGEGDFGAHGASWRVRDRVFIASDEIAADDLGERESYVVKTFGIFAGGVIEKVAVLGERGAEGVEPAAWRSVGPGVGLGDLNAGAA